jgi:hypothetical protein
MKQLLSLFLFLLPCLAWAQYPSNGNQKITLGEQTTADGLLFRGVAATDTVRKPSIDTMAYMVLDTTTNIIWHYKKATSNAWLRLNLLPSDTATMLTNYWRSGRFSGVLPVANGGTGSATKNFVDLTNTQTVAGAKTFSNAATFSSTLTTNGDITLNKNNNTDLAMKLVQSAPFYAAGLSFISNNEGGAIYNFIGSGVSGITEYWRIGSGALANTFTLSTGGSEAFRASSTQEVNIGYGATDNGAYKLQVNSQIFATNATIETSDIRFKENIQPLDKGLEIINKLKPVKFNFITTTENNFSEFDEIGFIAQDVEGALSTELFAKAVVKKLDEDKDDSALGLMTEKLIPILVKAIQEQQAQIKALEQRIINLENK